MWVWEFVYVCPFGQYPSGSNMSHLKAFLRGRLGTLVHQGKLLQPFSQHSRNQQLSSYNHRFVSFIQSYNSKQVPVGIFHAEKMGKIVIFNVFKKGSQQHSFLLKILSKKIAFGSDFCNFISEISRSIKLTLLVLLSWPCVFPSAAMTAFSFGSIQTRIASSTGQYGKI